MARIKVYVWSRFIRFFHINLILGMLIEYLSIEFGYKTLHVYIGYYLTGLLGLRVLYFFGKDPHAHFRAFRFTPRQCFAYLISLRRPDSTYFSGHNPAGAYMVMALLLTFFLLLVSGLFLHSYINYEGPLVFVTSGFSNGLSAFFKETHEIFFGIIVGLIVFHICGAALSSFLHKINLPWAMITGYRKIPARSVRR